MDDDSAWLDSGHDQIVIERPAIGDENYDGMTALNLLIQLIDRSRSGEGPPSAFFDGLHENIVGNPARVLVDERRELLDIRMHVTPVTKDHRGRRAAAERIRLRQVGDRQQRHGRH